MRCFELVDLKPSWLPIEKGGRFRVGLRFRCPLCPKAHYFVLWFANPGDKGPPTPGKQLMWMAGNNFTDISVAPQGADVGEPVDFDEHGPLWLVDGEVWMHDGRPCPPHGSA